MSYRPDTTNKANSRNSSRNSLIELQTTTKKQFNDNTTTTTIVSGNSNNGTVINDDAYLRQLGKRPLLSRSFGFMSILGFSCSALLSWEGILVNSVTALLNGGPAGVIWGFLINWLGTISVNTVLGEFASIAPTAGGQCKSPLKPSICLKATRY
jgi:amino acid permease